jgi:hypothetical protein
MFRHHRRLAAPIALAVALAAAAPAAARPELQPTSSAANPSSPASTNLCSEVCGARGYTAAEASVNLARNPTAGSVAHAGAGYGYGSSPPASTGSTSPRSEVVSGGGYGNPSVRGTVVHVVSSKDGFDWGDAGIGAGGALALMTLVIGGTVAATNIRRRTTRTTV